MPWVFDGEDFKYFNEDDPRLIRARKKMQTQTEIPREPADESVRPRQRRRKSRS